MKNILWTWWLPLIALALFVGYLFIFHPPDTRSMAQRECEKAGGIYLYAYGGGGLFGGGGVDIDCVFPPKVYK